MEPNYHALYYMEKNKREELENWVDIMEYEITSRQEVIDAYQIHYGGHTFTKRKPKPVDSKKFGLYN